MGSETIEIKLVVDKVDGVHPSLHHALDLIKDDWLRLPKMLAYFEEDQDTSDLSYKLAQTVRKLLAEDHVTQVEVLALALMIKDIDAKIFLDKLQEEAGKALETLEESKRAREKRTAREVN